MRFILFSMLMIVANTLFAGGVFVAKDSDDTLQKSYLLSNSPGSPTNSCADSDLGEFRYRVIVTSNEYASGWSALPKARKDAAKAAAESERTDFEAKFDKLLKAFALVTLDEINLLRVKAGLAPRTIKQLKTAVRNKYQELP